MRSKTLAFMTLALLGLMAGCDAASDDGSSTTTAAAQPEVQRQPEGATSYFSIEEVGVGDGGWVALENFTSVPTTLDGLLICQAENCFPLPDVVVGPDERVFIATGESAPVSGIVVTDAEIGELQPSDGELALYLGDTPDPENILAFLEWGSTPHVHTAAAIDSGLWLEGSFAPSGENATRLYRVKSSGLWLWDEAE